MLLPTWPPVSRETCFALSSTFAPISWDTKDSTPWTRPPFTTPPTFRSTRPKDRWERFYGVNKFRLSTSATQYTTYEHDSASDDPRIVTKAATFFTCCTRGVTSACDGGPTGRGPRTL